MERRCYSCKGVLEATELQGVRQERLNEDAGSTGTLIGIFFLCEGRIKSKQFHCAENGKCYG